MSTRVPGLKVLAKSGQPKAATLEEVETALKPLGLEIVGVSRPPAQRSETLLERLRGLVRDWNDKSWSAPHSDLTCPGHAFEVCAKELDIELIRNEGE